MEFEYFKKFGELPPQIYGVNENNIKYKNILKIAIKNNTKLTINDLQMYFNENGKRY